VYFTANVNLIFFMLILGGLSLHLRRAHEERYHQGEAGREVKKLRWDNGMLIRLPKKRR